MLNKEICKRCSSDGNYIWTRADEILWNEGMVWCMGTTQKNRNGDKDFTAKQININSLPPHYCRYKLEHIVMNEKGQCNEKSESMRKILF